MKTNLNIDIEKIRKMVQCYLDLHMYDTALFWAEKIMALTNNPRDIYWVGQCMYHLKQYHRAVHLLRSNNLDKTYVLCNYLTVRCLLSANELNEALNLINLIDIDSITNSNNLTRNHDRLDLTLFDDKPRNQVYSSIYFLKGKVLECSDNRTLASECYKKALTLDVYCFEAFDALTKYHMLSAQEEEELLNSLPIDEQCNKEESEILKTLYECKLKKYHTPTASKPNEFKILFQQPPLPELSLAITPKYIDSIASTPNLTSAFGSNVSLKERNEKNERNNKNMETDENVFHLMNLRNSLDLHVAQAERLYYNCDFQQCYLVTTAILKQDPYHSGCLPIHISCQVELGESNKLFSLAHSLVDLYPNLPISWYAVGCYYYIIGKSDYARRYLAKATCLDRLFGPAWMAYGHSFAIDNEHDQAMAAYFKASQLMKGCHLPLLYIGLECGLTNNVTLAEKFFNQALAIAPNDPFILHEKGVIAFQNGRYIQAEEDFKKALKIIKTIHPNLMPQRWVSLLNNLGHVCRKLKKYEEALEYHYQAMFLGPQKASIYSSIGYVNALMGNTEESVEWFHKALGLERNDTFSSSMLTYVIEQLSEELPSFPGAPSEIPKYEQKGRLNLSTLEVESEQSIMKESNLGISIHEEIRESASMSMTIQDVTNKDSSINMSVEMDMTDSNSNN